MRRLKIAGAALNQTPIDWGNNIYNVRVAIERAIENKVDILCLPELCITGYGCEDLFLSNWLPEKALRKLLEEIVPLTTDIAVAVGLPIKKDSLLYNCACFIENKTILGFTAKQYLANEGVHYEQRWFAPWPHSQISHINIDGSSYPFGDVTYLSKGINIAFEICEDAWQKGNRPGVRHCRKLNKLDLILNPSASHFAFAKSAFRLKNIVLEGATSFNCTYLYANLLGNEAGRMIFDGDIMIAQGSQLIQKNTRLSFDNVDLVHAVIDFDDPSKTEKPSLNYDDQSKEFEFRNALTLALFDYLRKSKSKGFTLSLSGGADSSVCAVIVAEMIKRGLSELGTDLFVDKLGIENLKTIPIKDAKSIASNILFCAYQSTKNSSSQTYESAEKLAEEVGASFYNWSIDEEVAGYAKKIENALGVSLDWSKHDIPLQNIQARTRSPIIWMLANIKNCLLLTTSNRSEGDVGYATMDGDTSGSIAPIAAVDKYFIRNWLLWAEKHLGYTSLHKVNRLQPTAELRPLENTQTDETDLMPYSILLEIEKKAIQQRLSPIEVFQSLKELDLEDARDLKKHVFKFFTMWCRNQWKRERIAVSFHLDDFNIDPKTWCRFPVLSGNYHEELQELMNLDS